MQTIKFDHQCHEAFAKELKTSVDQYFKDKKCRKGSTAILFKSFIILSLYLIPLIILGTIPITEAWLLFALYMTSGIGMAGIGMNIMHDALHGTFSSNSIINKIMCHSINLIGASASIWKIQHNVLHHTYTNVTDADDDLNSSRYLRFSPDKEILGVHRFQHIYAWPMYCLMTLVWVTARDFIRMNQYKKMGFFEKKNEYTIEILKAIFWKIVYFSYALVLPLIIVPQAWWLITLAFLTMHFITGFILSVVFQTAHVMPSSVYPKANDEGLIGNNWSAHQLYTTCNYAPKSKIFTWFIGGLNYQIEHHLMPHICHTHYKKISKIVKSVATKHNLPYHSHGTFVDAVAEHCKMLKALGNPQTV